MGTGGGGTTEVLDDAELAAGAVGDGRAPDDDDDPDGATLASGTPVGAEPHPPLADGDATRLGRPAPPRGGPPRADATEPTSRLTTGDLDAPEERVGERLGPYLLLELIGEGGMGAVYRAEQVATGGWWRSRCCTPPTPSVATRSRASSRRRARSPRSATTTSSRCSTSPTARPARAPTW
jgi:hypothetical protein